MASRQPPPTEGELEVLRACWALGRAKTRKIHEQVNVARKARGLPPLSFNTVATVLLKCVAKDFVLKIEEDPTRHEYEAIWTEEQTARSHASNVIRRLFRGSLVELVQNAFRDKKPSSDELSQLQKLIDQAGSRK